MRYWTATATKPRQKSVAGKKVLPGGKQIEMDVLLMVIEHALKSAWFEMGGTVYTQRRGAPIGFPLSAALSVITVMQTEMSLLKIHRPLTVTNLERTEIR